MSISIFPDQSDASCLEQPNLKGQVAVVFGGTSGIGLGLSKALVHLQCRVIVASRSGNQSSESTGVDHRSWDPDCGSTANGASPVNAICDVSRRNDVESLFDRVVNSFGSLDIVINCAGIGRTARTRSIVEPTMHLDEDEWQEVSDTNLRGMFLVAGAAARHMIPQCSGQILNISSARSARRGQPFAAAYSATKMASLALFRTLAAELAPHGIRAWSLLPDAVATTLIANTNLAKRGAMNPDNLGYVIANLLALPADAQLDEPLLAPFASFSAI